MGDPPRSNPTLTLDENMFTAAGARPERCQLWQALQVENNEQYVANIQAVQPHDSHRQVENHRQWEAESNDREIDR